MDALFAEMIATLVEASRAVQLDFERLTTAQPGDLPALVTLRDAVRTSSDQADSVFAMMLERNAPDPLLDRAEELVGFFQVVHARLLEVLPPEQV